MNPLSRYVIACLIAATLAGTVAWRVQEWRWTLKVNVEKLAQSEAARQREKGMTIANQGVDRAYQIKERRRAADAVVVAGRLRDLESALAAATDTTAPGSSDAPFAGIASECARKLVLMDDYASKLAGTASALQGYARSVCVVQ